MTGGALSDLSDMLATIDAALARSYAAEAVFASSRGAHAFHVCWEHHRAVMRGLQRLRVIVASPGGASTDCEDGPRRFLLPDRS